MKHLRDYFNKADFYEVPDPNALRKFGELHLDPRLKLLSLTMPKQAFINEIKRDKNVYNASALMKLEPRIPDNIPMDVFNTVTALVVHVKMPIETIPTRSIGDYKTHVATSLSFLTHNGRAKLIAQALHKQVIPGTTHKIPASDTIGHFGYDWISLRLLGEGVASQEIKALVEHLRAIDD